MATIAVRHRREDARHVRRLGFEFLPVEPMAVGLVLCLCIQSLGPVVVVIELLLLCAIAAVKWRTMAAATIRLWPLFALPLLACLSMFWSPVGDTSLRYGVQLLLTILMGLTIGMAVRPWRVPSIFFLGIGAALLAGLASGRTGLSLEGSVLIGFTGSKNQMGFISLFWVIASLCVAASSRHAYPMRFAAIAALPVAAFLVWQSNSMTALVSMVVIAVLLSVLALMAKLPLRGRQFLLLVCLMAAVPLVVAQQEISDGVERFTTDTLGKDTRLTGRTLLWEQADILIEQRPITGWGFKAIWLGPEGKGLLDRFDQEDGRAFNFHDTVREVRVDLGVVGLALFVLPLAYASYRMILLALNGPDAATAMAMAILAVALFRFRTDLILAPFLADTVFLYAAIATLARTRTATDPLPSRTIARALASTRRPQRTMT